MATSKLPQEKFALILESFSSGNIQETIDSIKTLLAEFPEDPVLFNILGACFAELGLYSEAIENYEISLSFNSNYAKAYYNLAGALHEVKEFDSAIIAYKKALDLEPDNTHALNNLGNTCREIGNNQSAIKYYKKAISINNDYAEANYSLGSTYQDIGQLEEAVKCYEKVLTLRPNFYELHNNTAIILQNLGKADSAIEHLNEALLINPSFTEAIHNLGSFYKELGDFKKAYDCFESALKNDSNYLEAYRSIGNLQMEMGLLDLSIKSFKKVLEYNPNYIEVLNNLGSVYKDLGNFDESLEVFEKALAINPNYLEVLNNLGLTLIELERFSDAIVIYKKAIAINSNYSYAYNNYGIALNGLHKYQEAEDFFIHAIRIEPNYYDANVNYGNSLFRNDIFDKAIYYYERSLEIKPGENYIFGDILHAKMQICHWKDWSNSIKKLTVDISKEKKIIGPFALTALIDNPDLIRKATEIFINDKFPKSSSLPEISKLPKHSKIRIGYFSADFREHPVSALTIELYENHCRDKFEVYAFSYGPDTNDPMNLRIKDAVDYFYDIRSMSNIDSAILVRSLELDIAIDLGGFTQDARTEIFSISIAPIQLSYIGYLGTMGASYYDYLIADIVIIPEKDQKSYTEKIVYLPTFQVNDSNQTETVTSLSRKDVGLPEKGFVFCCFNKSYKYNPRCFDIWARILNKVQNSVLIIYLENNLAQSNLKQEITQRGLDPARLIFGERLSRPEYLGRYKLADLFLDTNPYNAGATSSDALRMGLPVLTFYGHSFASRMGASLLRAVHMPELIASSEEEYEAMAIELGTNPKKLKTIKDKLFINLAKAELYNSIEFTKNIESAYTIMYDRYHKDLKPNHIHVNN
jgi:protein O-GlcNAc transferase